MSIGILYIYRCQQISLHLTSYHYESLFCIIHFPFVYYAPCYSTFVPYKLYYTFSFCVLYPMLLNICPLQIVLYIFLLCIIPHVTQNLSPTNCIIHFPFVYYTPCYSTFVPYKLYYTFSFCVLYTMLLNTCPLQIEYLRKI